MPETVSLKRKESLEQQRCSVLSLVVKKTVPDQSSLKNANTIVLKVYMDGYILLVEKCGGLWPPFSASLFGDELKLIALLIQLEQLFSLSSAFWEA